jgi:hypothetical protein
MIRPQMWLRNRRLQRALRDYPLYDVPHKVEDRLLPRDAAAENFAYFMDVRHQRLAHLQEWLKEFFGTTVTTDEWGLGTLCRWGVKYAGLLMTREPIGRARSCFDSYTPLWTGVNAGYNVVFDMGILLGESIIASCPNIRWDFDPISSLLPRTAKWERSQEGLGFQRPQLTGYPRRPEYRSSPFYVAREFADLIMYLMVTFEGMRRYKFLSGKRNIRERLLNFFRAEVDNYRHPHEDPRRKTMTEEEYLRLIDSEDKQEEGEGGHE